MPWKFEVRPCNPPPDADKPTPHPGLFPGHAVDERPAYPKATCMDCGHECTRFVEHVDIGGGEIELWCYCPTCDVETFHPLPRCYW